MGESSPSSLEKDNRLDISTNNYEKNLIQNE